MQLGHAQRADGRWRIFAFGGDDATELLDLVEWLGAPPESPVVRFTPAGADLDSVIDVHGVFRCGHHEVDSTALPQMLLPQSGPLGLQDWEKACAIDPRNDIFAERQIDGSGAIVIVRPDQYVANVLPLTARRAHRLLRRVPRRPAGRCHVMTDVVTDDGAELEPYRHTGYLLRRAQQLHVATWARIVSTDISTVQYSILVVLDREGE